MLCVAVLLGFVSCGLIYTDEEDNGVAANETQVSFILSLSNATEGTRAGTTWGDGYDSQTANAYENRIDPSTVQVLIYDAENVAHKVNILSYIQTASGGDEYEFIGSVTDDLPAGDYKLMVFANAASVEGVTDLGTLSYSYDNAAFNAQTQLIPMWGVGTYYFTLKKGERVTLKEPIYLLRAMAKVEIQLADEIKDLYDITGATLSRYNSEGYVTPQDYATVANTKDLEQETGTYTTFHPNAGAGTGNLTFLLSNDNKTATLYIPEYANTAGNEATISLTLDDRHGPYTLEFREYIDGQPTGTAHDIVRNHIYRYTVKKVIQYTVCPWLSYDIKIPNFD